MDPREFAQREAAERARLVAEERRWEAQGAGGAAGAAEAAAEDAAAAAAAEREALAAANERRFESVAERMQSTTQRGRLSGADVVEGFEAHVVSQYLRKGVPFGLTRPTDAPPDAEAAERQTYRRVTPWSQR